MTYRSRSQCAIERQNPTNNLNRGCDIFDLKPVSLYLNDRKGTQHTQDKQILFPRDFARKRQFELYLFQHSSIERRHCVMLNF